MTICAIHDLTMGNRKIDRALLKINIFEHLNKMKNCFFRTDLYNFKKFKIVDFT